MNRKDLFSMLCLAAAASLSVAGPARAVDDFHAYLIPALPDTIHVAWMTTVDVPFWVDSSARQFNGYDLMVRCDPGVVRPDTVLDGPLFVAACPNRWRRLEMTDSTIVFSNVLLCAGVAVDGPGSLCYLRFYARSPGTSSLSILSDPDRTFYDAGYYVWPQHPSYPRQVFLHPAVISVYNPTAEVPPAGAALPGLDLRILPNPVDEGCALEFFLPQPGQAELQLFRVDGRVIGSWPLKEGRAGVNSILWGRRDAEGRRLPGGYYFLRMRSGASAVTRKVLLVQ